MEKRSIDLFKVFKVLAIIASAIFLIFAITSGVKADIFARNCENYIKLAADANSIELAKENLSKAIEYAEENGLTNGIVHIFIENPKNDLGFWYRNMKDAYSLLESIPTDATEAEKATILLKLNESLTDQGRSEYVTTPEGISIYPNNILYCWWGIISFISAVVFWILMAIAEVDDWKYTYYYKNKKAIDCA